MSTDRDRDYARDLHELGLDADAPTRAPAPSIATRKAEALARVLHFVPERESIRLAKAAGLPKPWTTDPILRDNRFCNIRRQDDVVSQYITTVWHRDAGSLSPGQNVANAALGRLINHVQTLEELASAGVNREFNVDIVRRILRGRVERNEQFLGGAYIISPVVPTRRGMPTPRKHESIPEQAAIAFREGARILDPTSMERTVERMSAAIRGFDSFMSGQAVADLRYAVHRTWADRDTYAPMGPGSRRGLAWLCGWDGVDGTVAERLVKPAMFLPYLRLFRQRLMQNEPVREVLVRLRVEMADVQSILCETDKFSRIATGTGKAKYKYPGAA